MQIAVTFRQLEADGGVKDYIEKRLKRLKKYLAHFREIHVVLSRERYRYIAESTLLVDGVRLNSEGRDSDLYTAIDQMVEKVERQVRERKLKERKKRSSINSTKIFIPTKEDSFEDQEKIDLSSLIKRKRKIAKPMALEEAVAQLKLSKEDFFFFINLDSGHINALYQTKDGKYEWIEPQVG